MVQVRNAVILAAGAATRFVPLSLEQPKGLYEVNGQRLIDRQIEQLLEAGIKDITLVLGYKKEMFYYLKEKYGVKFIINPDYLLKNNIESLRLAKDILGNSYVCSSDDYFVVSPFKQQEEHSFYAGLYVGYKTNEMYVDLDSEGRIINMEKGRPSGRILLGHSFWTEDFCRQFFSLVDADQKPGKYNNSFWEWLVKDNLSSLPPFFFKQYPLGFIYEFDFFEELRNFDKSYIVNSNSKIISNIRSVFNCSDEDIVEFRCINEGLTNTSFIFRIAGNDYIYRHPGDGTKKIINRKNEQTSLEYARDLGFDPTYIYMDVDEGWKISKYVPSFLEPDYSSFEDSKKIIAVMRKLHTSKVTVDYGLNPWDDACEIEVLLKEKDPHCFEPFEDLKARIATLYQSTIDDGVKKCFCHGDTYCHNWMIEPSGNVILIDWEYSGFSDPGIDVGYYIVDAMYDLKKAKEFIKEYLQNSWTPILERHYLVYTALIAYYWFVWAMYRESCGANVGDSRTNWMTMAERFCDYLRH
jgi:CTP:phosphocholine cytidylyltransferase-like protein/thiamine kinase-like enzyme